MDINDIITLYEQGKSLAFIANKYNTYGAKIKQILTDNGIQTRTHAEQNRITNQSRAKKVNHQYFDVIDTPQKAWILGFIAADGTISKNRNSIKIGLSSVDREILEKIKSEMQIEKKILDYETNQGFSISELTWSSENHKQKLAKYDIIPNKTYHIIHIPKLSTDLQLAYLLGFFDGDGCFKDDGLYFRIEICSYRSEILQDFATLLFQNFQCTLKTPYKEPSRNLYTLTYSTQDAEQFLNYIYTYMLEQNCFFLQRKYMKYYKWKERNNKI